MSRRLLLRSLDFHQKGYRPLQFGFFKTSNVELWNMFKAWFAISLAFGIVLGGVSLKLPVSFLLSAFTVGIGFLLHEAAHKVTAQRLGYPAEFRSMDEMLFLAVMMSFLGFVFAAPGATMIFARVLDINKNGKISIAGPLVNLILAGVFLLGLVFLSPSFLFLKELLRLDFHLILESLPLRYALPLLGIKINGWLALFNMLPFWLFDGKKVWAWNKFIYGLVVLLAIMVVFVV